jgi:protein tyrosine phosphatase
MIWLNGYVDKPFGYINCSRIKSAYKEPVGHMIATQAPIPESIDAFWRLVVQERVKMVITVG